MALLEKREIDDARSRDIASLAESFGVQFASRRGKWWPGCCPFPDHDDGSPSFYACPSAGKFKCHGCGRHGDSIELAMEMQPGLSFREAVDQLNGKVTATFTAPPKRELVAVEDEPVDAWERVTDLAGAPPIPDPWRKCRGIPHVGRHEFRAEDGTLVAFIDRFKEADKGDDKSRRKVLIPHTCWFNPQTSEIKWLPRGFADDQPRPLYRLHLLREYPSAKVLLVEGERKADIAQQRLAEAGIKPEQLLVMGWHGGAEVAAQVDIEPLRDRAVRLWPDADQHAYKALHPRAGEVMPPLEQSGNRAMLTLFDRIEGIASHVLLIMPPDGMSDGWDLGDTFPPDFDLRQHLTNKENCIMADTLRQMVAAMRAAPATPTLVLDNTKQPPPANDSQVEYDPNAPLPLDGVFADDLPEQFEAPDELVEGLFTSGARTIFYGDSNSGKTFLAIDIACAIARGVTWMDRNVESGLVVYVATESPASVRSRLQGYKQHHGCRVPNFVIVQAPVNLWNGNGDTVELIRLVRMAERKTGKKAMLIIGDTLARLSAGANENSGEDMGLIVERIDRIRAETGAHFMLIHHSGKDASKGARGHSSARAAVDTEIEVTDSPQGRCAEVTKQRDIGGKGDRIGFRLEVVQLGLTKWGEPATTCIVEPEDAPNKPKRGKQLSEREGAIVEFLSSHRPRAVRKSEVTAHFKERYDRSNLYASIRKLVAGAIIHEAAGMLCIAASVP